MTHLFLRAVFFSVIIAGGASATAALPEGLQGLGLRESPVASRDLPGWEKPQRIVVWAPFGPQLATRGSRREGLDVTDPEPLPADHPLWRTPRVIITPHVAATSAETYARMQALVTENLRRYIAGEPLLSVVDIQRGY